MASDLTFLEARDDKDAAWELCLRYAETLRRIGDVERYGVKVQQIPRQSAWGVYLKDRHPQRQTDPHLVHRISEAMAGQEKAAPVPEDDAELCGQPTRPQAFTMVFTGH